MAEYLHRTLENVILKASERFKVVMVSGMRQVGKSTLLQKLSDHRTSVSVDVFENLLFAKNRPMEFLKRYSSPALIDEIQLVPELFPALKATVDKSDDRGQYWITGSQRLALMKGVSDCLPGRLLPFELLPFSIYEREGLGLDQKPYIPSENILFQKPMLTHRTVEQTWEVIFQGAWPDVIGDSEQYRLGFFKTLVELYLSKDVKDYAGVDKTIEFQKFLQALAIRSGQELKLNALATEVGISVITLKRWLSIAQATGLIFYLPAFSVNINKQLVKSPKIYMIDTGLIAYLLGIQSPSEMSRHTNAGSFFETFVISEIYKSWVHNGLSPDFYFLREQNGMEIDLLIHHNGRYHAVECKTTAIPSFRSAKWISHFKRWGINTGMSAVISTVEEPFAISEDVIVHSIWEI